jgi:hypothetical protein
MWEMSNAYTTFIDVQERDHFVVGSSAIIRRCDAMCKLLFSQPLIQSYMHSGLVWKKNSDYLKQNKFTFICGLEYLEFESWQVQEIHPFSMTSRLALGPTQHLFSGFQVLFSHS